MTGSRRKLSDLELAERRDKLVTMRSQGHSWDHIAATLGYSDKGAACKDLARALDQRNEQLALTLDQYRRQQLDNLIELRDTAAEVMRRRHLLVQSGKVVRNDDPRAGELGDPLYDDGPTLAAIDRIAKIDAQIAALLGLNAPTKVEAEGKLTVEVVGVDPGALT